MKQLYFGGLGPKEYKFISFDLETWDTKDPFGISCAATMEQGLSPRTWYESPLSDARPLSERQAGFLVEYLALSQERGYTTLTWNGLAFDFKILAEVSGQPEICAGLALNHVDMMFQFFCAYGYRVGLDTVSRGLGLPGKEGYDDVSGENSPAAWRKDKPSRIRVLEYLESDVRNTLAVSKAAADAGCFTWTSKKGRQMSKPFGGRWKTVQECINTIPLPDTSWMDSPATREDFLKWIYTIREVTGEK